MKLSQDVISGSKKIYGRKGEEVAVISVYGDVMIVQHNTGNRFAVHKELLTEAPIPEKNIADDEKTENIISKPDPVKRPKASKPAPQKQNTLFNE